MGLTSGKIERVKLPGLVEHFIELKLPTSGFHFELARRLWVVIKSVDKSFAGASNQDINQKAMIEFFPELVEGELPTIHHSKESFSAFDKDETASSSSAPSSEVVSELRHIDCIRFIIVS